MNLDLDCVCLQPKACGEELRSKARVKVKVKIDVTSSEYTVEDAASNVDTRAEILFDKVFDNEYVPAPDNLLQVSNVVVGNVFESLTELTKDMDMKGKDIENNFEKLEKEVANMKDSIARTEVELSCSTAFEFEDLFDRAAAIEAIIDVFETAKMNDVDDDGDEDESDELHATLFWMLYSRVEDLEEFNDLLDEATDADIGFSDWMCDYGTDKVMELEEGARDD